MQERIAKCRIAGEGLQLAELTEIGDPSVADGFGNRIRERRIRQQQPAAGCDPIRLIVEPFGIEFGQVLHRHRTKQFGMNGGHPIGAVGSDNGQIGHTDFAPGAFLHKAHPLEAALVSGKAVSNHLEQTAVDLENDLEMPRQHMIEPFERPFFQCLGQQRMVRIGERPLRQVPGLIPSQMRLVEQDTHKFGNGHGWMGVIQLDGDFFRKGIPILSCLGENGVRDRPTSRPPENILEGIATPVPWMSSHRGIAHA